MGAGPVDTAAPSARVSAADVDSEIARTVSVIATTQVRAERIAEDVAFLADDARNGRETGTPGYDDAARYVAARFDALGLSPSGDAEGPARSWFQEVPLRRVVRDLDAASFVIRNDKGEERKLDHLEDYLIGRSFAAPTFDVTAPAVFVGFGVSAPEEGHDDYAGLDVDGKIVIAFDGAPDMFNSEKRAFYASRDAKYKTAASHGAVGFVAAPTAIYEARRPWTRIIANPSIAAMTWVRPDGTADSPSPAIRATATMSMEGADALFDFAGREFEQLLAAADEKGRTPEGFELPIEIALKGASDFEDLSSDNVVGVIEGADPTRKNEAVVLTAHLDHVGYRTPKEAGGDGVRNGAMDNAMGVAVLLEAARSFKSGPPPRRTVVFLALTGEEKGLLGADYFVHFPSLGGKKIVANINLDMPLTLFPFEDVIAFGAERSTLGDVVRDAAAQMDIALIPDPIADQGIFTRSDHYRFVEKGVPSIFLFVGFGNGGDQVFADFMQNHYHQPSDEITLPIDYAAAARFAELNYAIARAVADGSTPPAWVEGDFFGTKFGLQDTAR